MHAEKLKQNLVLGEHSVPVSFIRGGLFKPHIKYPCQDQNLAEGIH